MTMTTRAGRQGGPEDHHHDSTPNCCHEQLLMGWKQGAMRMGMTRRHHPLSLQMRVGGGFHSVLGDYKHHHPLSRCIRHNGTLPAPSLTSNCSLGGLQVE